MIYFLALVRNLIHLHITFPLKDLPADGSASWRHSHDQLAKPNHPSLRFSSFLYNPENQLLASWIDQKKIRAHLMMIKSIPVR